MQTPKILRDLLQSNKYWNKNSAEFAKANEYLENLVTKVQNIKI